MFLGEVLMTTTKQPARTPRAPGAQRAPSRDDALDRQDDRGPILSRSGKPASIRLTGGEDRFHVPSEIVPVGWTYEWKVVKVLGAPDTERIVQASENGWEPVPAERHDGIFMPRGYKGLIERGGQMLMERDDRLTAQARAYECKAAGDQLDISRSMAGLMNRQMPGGSGILDYEHPAARQATGISRSREALGDKRDPGYTYQVDE